MQKWIEDVLIRCQEILTFRPTRRSIYDQEAWNCQGFVYLSSPHLTPAVRFDLRWRHGSISFIALLWEIVTNPVLRQSHVVHLIKHKHLTHKRHGACHMQKRFIWIKDKLIFWQKNRTRARHPCHRISPPPPLPPTPLFLHFDKKSHVSAELMSNYLADKSEIF